MFFVIVLIFLFVLKTINLPLIFKIVIPTIIIIALFIITFGIISNAMLAVYLSKSGNKLYIKRVLFPLSNEETISLKKDSKLVLVKFMPLSTFGRYQLLIKSGDYLEVIVPKTKWYKLLKYYTFYSPGTAMRSFIYTKEDARKISKLLKIPLEISNKEIVAYVKDFNSKYG